MLRSLGKSDRLAGRKNMHQKPYKPAEIEVRVQAQWDENRTYEVTEDPGLEKY